MKRFLVAFLLVLIGPLVSHGEEPPATPPAAAPPSTAPPAAGSPGAEPTSPPAVPATPPPAVPATAAPAAPAAPAGPPPAADGTVSVVVPPSATPVVPPSVMPTVPPTVIPKAPPIAAPPGSAGEAAVRDPLLPAAAAPPSATNAPPPLPPGPATSLIATAFEPVKRPAAAGGGPAIDPAIYARPLSLVEAFERSGDRSRRLWIAQGYWKASAACVSLAWAVDARDRLATTGPGSDPYDRAALEVAVASADAAVVEAKADLQFAQQELADLARLPFPEPLPWPVDRPLGTAYATHFDVIFSQRLATGRVRAINRGLPMKHEGLESRAKAVQAAEEALAAAEGDHARGKRPIEAVLAAHAALATQRRQFLELVRGYNTDIAEYVMAVADFSVPDDQFAAMLIGSPSP